MPSAVGRLRRLTMTRMADGRIGGIRVSKTISPGKLSPR
jgi:hypothetical protein